MKRIFALFLMFILALSLCACDGSGTPADTASSTDNLIDETHDLENQPVDDITMDDVISHSESPASDFLCKDDGNGGLVIVKYLGNSEIVVIPENIDGKAVSKINRYVFGKDSSVKGVKLSSTIKEIGAYAFAQNKNLQYVVFGSDVQTVGESAFQACISLKEASINNSLKQIRQLAFAQCTALKSVTLPESIETIEVIAFNMMAEDFKIIGKAGSTAEVYAQSESITFEAKK